MAISARLSAEEFDTFLLQTENLNRRFELIQGEIIEKMPTQLHAFIIQMLSGFLFMYLRQNPIGYALIEARYRLPTQPENDIIPDLSFIVKERGALVAKGAAPYMPDLAVEAQSDGQSDKFMLEKAQLYLAQGTRMVWIVYPTRQIVEVFTQTERHLLTIHDTLTGGDVLPNLSIPVYEIFPRE